MEDHKINEFPCPPEASDWAQDALVPKKPPFSANRREQLLAFGLYVLAYLYLGYQWWALPLFTAGFIAAAEYLFREQKRSWESWVWLGCVLLVTGCIAWRGLHPYQYDSRYPELVNHEYILSEKLLLFILHIFAVYWLMSRSGRLTGGESGHLLPLDALYAFVIIPFKNFFLRIRCVLFALKPKKERKINAGAVAAAVLAAFVVLVLLVMAMTQLSAAEAARRAGGRLARSAGRVQRALSRVFLRAGPLSVRRVHADAPGELHGRGVRPPGLLRALPRHGDQLHPLLARLAHRPAGKPSRALDDGGASDREYALRRRRPVQARALYRLLRLHAQAPAKHLARVRSPVRQRLRALYPPDGQKVHARLDDLRRRHAFAAVHLVNCRVSADFVRKKSADTPLTAPTACAIIIKLFRKHYIAG